jgi:hypothetical protein
MVFNPENIAFEVPQSLMSSLNFEIYGFANAATPTAIAPKIIKNNTVAI